MARRQTDLLDIFRRPDDGAEGTAGAGRKAAQREARDRKPAKESKSRGAPSPTVVLTRRQIWLGGSALALLIVLGFILGLATGRAGGPSDPAALSRAARAPAEVFLQGRIDGMDPSSLRPVEPGEVFKELVSRHGLPADHLSVARDGTDLLIQIGPFPSRERAEAYARDNKLDLITIRMSAPFRWPQFSQR